MVTLENEVLKSDSASFYIGKTKNFLFYHKTKTNTTRVIPCDRIKEMQFGNKIDIEIENKQTESDSIKKKINPESKDIDSVKIEIDTLK